MMRFSRACGICVILTVFFLTGCKNNGITQIKYIQHQTSTKLKIGNSPTLTAPSGQHYMLYLINCIDNSSVNDGFYFTSTRLRNLNNQDTQLAAVPQLSTIVGAGQTKENIGQVVMLNPGPPDKVIENMSYASHGTESVLMVNQTPPGVEFGPSFFWVDEIELNSSSAQSSPFVKDNPCASSGSTPHG